MTFPISVLMVWLVPLLMLRVRAEQIADPMVAQRTTTIDSCGTFHANNATIINCVNKGVTGRLPLTLGALEHMQSLYLNNNHIEGNIPATLAKLDNLRNIHLQNNMISGTMPEAEDLLKALPESERAAVAIKLKKRSMKAEAGAGPKFLGQLSGLYLNHNKISGTISPELFAMPQLTHLDLGENQLSGSLPANFGYQKSNIQWLRVEENYLRGDLPQLWNFPFMEWLDLSANNFSGYIPRKIGNMDKLWNLQLQDNFLSGTIPASLTELPHLCFVNLSGNNLTGCEDFVEH